MNRRSLPLLLKLADAVEIADGNLCTISHGNVRVSEDLDMFSLHDSMLYRYDVAICADEENMISVYGLLPCFSSMFKISFYDVSSFAFKNADFLNFFSVKELNLTMRDSFHAWFAGDFEDQFFSFSFSSARFKKYSLRSPLSREDLGL
jgi:hypothetical protein